MFQFVYMKLVNNHVMFKWKLMENAMHAFCRKITSGNMFLNCDIV